MVRVLRAMAAPLVAAAGMDAATPRTHMAVVLPVLVHSGPVGFSAAHAARCSVILSMKVGFPRRSTLTTRVTIWPE
jgi:hypothetical protein